MNVYSEVSEEYEEWEDRQQRSRASQHEALLPRSESFLEQELQHSDVVSPATAHQLRGEGSTGSRGGREAGEGTSLAELAREPGVGGETKGAAGERSVSQRHGRSSVGASGQAVPADTPGNTTHSLPLSGVNAPSGGGHERSSEGPEGGQEGGQETASVGGMVPDDRPSKSKKKKKKHKQVEFRGAAGEEEEKKLRVTSEVTKEITEEHLQRIRELVQTGVYGLDQASASPNVQVMGGAPCRARRAMVQQSTDGVRGAVPLDDGRHLVEIDVSKRPSGSHCAVGVCTERATLQHDGYVDLLGRDAHSWGLDLPSGRILHGGKTVGTFLVGDNRVSEESPGQGDAAAGLPKKVLMLVDRKKRSLAFDVGKGPVVCFTDLPRRGRALYPAVSLVYGHAEAAVTLKTSSLFKKYKHLVAGGNDQQGEPGRDDEHVAHPGDDINNGHGDDVRGADDDVIIADENVKNDRGEDITDTDNDLRIAGRTVKNCDDDVRVAGDGGMEIDDDVKDTDHAAKDTDHDVKDTGHDVGHVHRTNEDVHHNFAASFDASQTIDLYNDGPAAPLPGVRAVGQDLQPAVPVASAYTAPTRPSRDYQMDYSTFSGDLGADVAPHQPRFSHPLQPETDLDAGAPSGAATPSGERPQYQITYYKPKTSFEVVEEPPDVVYTSVSGLSEDDRYLMQIAHGWDFVNRGSLIQPYPSLPYICQPMPSLKDKVQGIRAKKGFRLQGKHTWRVRELKMHSPHVPLSDVQHTYSDVIIGVASEEQRSFNFGFTLTHMGRHICGLQPSTKLVWHDGLFEAAQQLTEVSDVNFDDLDIDMTLGMELILNMWNRTLTFRYKGQIVAVLPGIQGDIVYPFLLYNQDSFFPFELSYVEGPQEYVTQILERMREMPSFDLEEVTNIRLMMKRSYSRRDLASEESARRHYLWGSHSPEVALKAPSIGLGRSMAVFEGGGGVVVAGSPLTGGRHEVDFVLEGGAAPLVLALVGDGFPVKQLSEGTMPKAPQGAPPLGLDLHSWSWDTSRCRLHHAGVCLGKYPAGPDLDVDAVERYRLSVDFRSTGYHTAAVTAFWTQDGRPASRDLGIAFVCLPDRLRPALALAGGSAGHGNTPKVRLAYASGPWKPDGERTENQQSTACHIL